MAGAARSRSSTALTAYGDCSGSPSRSSTTSSTSRARSETLGKTAGKDERQQKITYPGIHGLAESKARAAALTREAHAALAPLGPAAEPLRALADFILNRKA